MTPATNQHVLREHRPRFRTLLSPMRIDNLHTEWASCLPLNLGRQRTYVNPPQQDASAHIQRRHLGDRHSSYLVHPTFHKIAAPLRLTTIPARKPESRQQPPPPTPRGRLPLATGQHNSSKWKGENQKTKARLLISTPIANSLPCVAGAPSRCAAQGRGRTTPNAPSTVDQFPVLQNGIGRQNRQTRVRWHDTRPATPTELHD